MEFEKLLKKQGDNKDKDQSLLLDKNKIKRINSFLGLCDRTNLINNNQINQFLSKENMVIEICSYVCGSNALNKKFPRIKEFKQEFDIDDSENYSNFFIISYPSFFHNFRENNDHPYILLYRIDENYYYIVDSYGEKDTFFKIKEVASHPLSTFSIVTCIWYFLGLGFYMLPHNIPLINFFMGWTLFGVILNMMGGFVITFLLMLGVYRLVTPYNDENADEKKISYYNKLLKD